MALRSTGEEILKDPELLALSCSIAAKKKLGLEQDPAAIHLKPTRLKEYDYMVENNLEGIFQLSQLDAHAIIEGGILAISQRNDRIELINWYNSVSGFSDDDLPVFGQKLAFVEASLSPKVKEERFRRVIELRGLPSIANQNQIAINAKRLLQIRDSPECVEFRNGLANADEASDEEIEGFSRSISTRWCLHSVKHRAHAPLSLYDRSWNDPNARVNSRTCNFSKRPISTGNSISLLRPCGFH